MYSSEEIKELLKGEKLINGECWINVREADHKKIKMLISDEEELSIQELVDMVGISEDDVIKMEDIDLLLINNKITEKEAIKQKEILQKEVINLHVKHKKGTDYFYITRAQDLLSEKEL